MLSINSLLLIEKRVGEHGITRDYAPFLYNNEKWFLNELLDFLINPEDDYLYEKFYKDKIEYIYKTRKIEKRKIKEIIKNIIKRDGISSLFSEFYIILDNVSKKYESFTERTSKYSFFLIRNITTDFRDFLRKRINYYKRLDNIVFYGSIDENIAAVENDAFKNIDPFDNELPFGIDINGSMLLEKHIYSKCHLGLKSKEIADLISFSQYYYAYVIDRDINKIEGIKYESQ